MDTWPQWVLPPGTQLICIGRRPLNLTPCRKRPYEGPAPREKGTHIAGNITCVSEVHVPTRHGIDLTM